MNRRAKLLLGVLVLSAFAGTACADAEQPSEIPPTGQLPADHPPLAEGATVPGQPSAGQEVARVKETMDSGGYTYVLAELGDQEMWLAGPETEMAVDNYIAVSGGMAMENFESSSLGRTFDVIYFVDRFYVLTDDDITAMEAALAPDPGLMGTVLQAKTTAGYTYAEVETVNGTIWLAGPTTQVEVGETVTWPEGMIMNDFESKSLERTFAEILFVSELRVMR